MFKIFFFIFFIISQFGGHEAHADLISLNCKRLFMTNSLEEKYVEPFLELYFPKNILPEILDVLKIDKSQTSLLNVVDNYFLAGYLVQHFNKPGKVITYDEIKLLEKNDSMIKYLSSENFVTLTDYILYAEAILDKSDLAKILGQEWSQFKGIEFGDVFFKNYMRDKQLLFAQIFSELTEEELHFFLKDLVIAKRKNQAEKFIVNFLIDRV